MLEIVQNVKNVKTHKTISQHFSEKKQDGRPIRIPIKSHINMILPLWLYNMYLKYEINYSITFFVIALTQWMTISSGGCGGSPRKNIISRSLCSGYNNSLLPRWLYNFVVITDFTALSQSNLFHHTVRYPCIMTGWTDAI